RWNSSNSPPAPVRGGRGGPNELVCNHMASVCQKIEGAVNCVPGGPAARGKVERQNLSSPSVSTCNRFAIEPTIGAPLLIPQNSPCSARKFVDSRFVRRDK